MAINFSTSTQIYRWRPACWLRVTGEDAANFLQGQFTNDLRSLKVGEAIYGLWLTLKGKVLADSFVVSGAGAQEFWIGSYFSAGTVIRERLESHVIADDVVVEDLTADWAGVTIVGEGSLAASGLAACGAVISFLGRRGETQGVEWMYPVGEGGPAWLEQLAAARALPAEEMNRRRIEAGIPAVPQDVGLADLPNEAGLEAEAISYTKGCYLGQEVMARLKAMGQVRRRLCRVESSAGAIPAVPAPLFAGARQVGELRSVAQRDGESWVGLAMLTLMHVPAGTTLSCSPEGVGSVRVHFPR